MIQTGMGSRGGSRFSEKRGSRIFDVGSCSVFEVGGGAGVLHPCQPSVIRTETPSFWRLTSLSFEGHLEKQKSTFLVIKCKQRFFGSISTIRLSAGDEAQRCRENWSKRAIKLIVIYLLPLTTYFQIKLHSTGPYATIHKGGSKWKGKWKK